MKKWVFKAMCSSIMAITLLMGCSNSAVTKNTASESTLIYGTHEYTTINPVIEEHGEINSLIFNGLTAHDKHDNIIPSLAKSWEFDENTNTYTFHLEDNVKWHDGEPFTAEDVKFTIEAIKDPKNESEIASNYEDVKDIKVIDQNTISFTLSDKNVAFLEYMTIGIVPKHLLQGKDFHTDEFFRNPIGTGPYKIEKWDAGQSITLERNQDYFQGVPNIENIIFKFVGDDTAKALQLKSGEIDLARITPKDAIMFDNSTIYDHYQIKTADYRGIMYNFKNEFWKRNKALILAINYGIDRQAMIESVLLGQGEVAYGPLLRNRFNNENVEKYGYNRDKAEEIIKAQGFVKGKDGYYEKNGKVLGFTISCMAGNQVRIDLANIAVQQLKQIGINVKVEVVAKMDWDNYQAFLVGWGSPFDADDHTYKVFGTDKGNNFNGYSNENVDKYLTLARQSEDENIRAEAYNNFQQELANDPPYTFLCYIDANYIVNKKISGITPNTVLGHHGVGVFYNIKDWKIN